MQISKLLLLSFVGALLSVGLVQSGPLNEPVHELQSQAQAQAQAQAQLNAQAQLAQSQINATGEKAITGDKPKSTSRFLSSVGGYEQQYVPYQPIHETQYQSYSPASSGYSSPVSGHISPIGYEQPIAQTYQPQSYSNYTQVYPLPSYSSGYSSSYVQAPVYPTPSYSSYSNYSIPTYQNYTAPVQSYAQTSYVQPSYSQSYIQPQPYVQQSYQPQTYVQQSYQPQPYVQSTYPTQSSYSNYTAPVQSYGQSSYQIPSYVPQQTVSYSQPIYQNYTAPVQSYSQSYQIPSYTPQTISYSQPIYQNYTAPVQSYAQTSYQPQAYAQQQSFQSSSYQPQSYVQSYGQPSYVAQSYQPSYTNYTVPTYQTTSYSTQSYTPVYPTPVYQPQNYTTQSYTPSYSPPVPSYSPSYTSSYSQPQIYEQPIQQNYTTPYVSQEYSYQPQQSYIQQQPSYQPQQSYVQQTSYQPQQASYQPQQSYVQPQPVYQQTYAYPQQQSYIPQVTQSYAPQQQQQQGYIQQGSVSKRQLNEGTISNSSLQNPDEEMLFESASSPHYSSSFTDDAGLPTGDSDDAESLVVGESSISASASVMSPSYLLPVQQQQQPKQYGTVLYAQQVNAPVVKQQQPQQLESRQVYLDIQPEFTQSWADFPLPPGVLPQAFRILPIYPQPQLQYPQPQPAQKYQFPLGSQQQQQQQPTLVNQQSLGFGYVFHSGPINPASLYTQVPLANYYKFPPPTVFFSFAPPAVYQQVSVPVKMPQILYKVGYSKRSLKQQEPYQQLVDHLAAASEANVSTVSVECPPKAANYVCPRLLSVEELKKSVCQYESAIGAHVHLVPDSDKSQTRCGSLKNIHIEARNKDIAQTIAEGTAAIIGKDCEAVKKFFAKSAQEPSVIEVLMLSRINVPSAAKFIVADGSQVDLVSAQAISAAELGALLRQCPPKKAQ